MFNKKIVLAYSGNLIESVLIHLLKKNNFDIICFVKYDNFKQIKLLKKKLQKHNIKKIFIKKINYFFLKIIFINLKFNFINNNFLYFQKTILSFLIIKELIKISFYFKTNYLFLFFKKKKIKKYLYYFNKNLKLINLFNIYNLNIKNILLKYINKFNLNIYCKKKFLLNKNIYNKSIIENYIEYPIFLTFTFKNGVLIKINNIEYNFEKIILKLNRLLKLSNFKFKNNNFCYNYIKLINLIKKNLEKKILKKNQFYIKYFLLNKYFNLFFKNKIIVKEINFIENMINFIENMINFIVKIKIFKGIIYIINYYII
ncbi:hypothetical protein G3R23_00675 [Candidatus Carsonella ruddii]